MPDPASGPTSRPSSETERGSPRISILLSDPNSSLMRSFEREINETQEWFDSPRFAGIVRLYTARQVVEQRGTIGHDYTIAREAAAAFYDRLCELFAERKSITTFGPYSPGQAVAMKRMGIEAIYLGGWATSAKGGTSEDPGPDLASYPLSQVPDEAATFVRALLSADRNQQYLRSRMTEAQRAATNARDFRPFIIADADTGHGGDPHVRNLIRRFVEAGVPGYHIEDQRPGTKKCGHQGGKVLVAQDEQNKRLNAARFQLDVMGVPGLIVARTDAEAANLIEGRGDERDQPFLVGATNPNVPAYKPCFLALIQHFHELGVAELTGYLLYAIPAGEHTVARGWLERRGILAQAAQAVASLREWKETSIEAMFDRITTRFLDAWEDDAELNTFGDAVAEVIEFRSSEGEPVETSVDDWRRFAARASLYSAREKAHELGIDVDWQCEAARTPEGYYQVRGGIPFAIAKSLAAAPFADLLWMETKTANLDDAREFAEAIHSEFPDKMLAYNLSPSFNWDTTGMSDEEMRSFPEELGKLGFVFNFITYGGHQIDGLAAEEFATALVQDGMLSLARLPRQFRLLELPYRTPQTLVGGQRMDAALMAASGRTATTKAMGKGSTQHQHLVQTEVPPRLLEEWLKIWADCNKVSSALHAQLRPVAAGAELLELSVWNESKDKLVNVIFTDVQDRRGHKILGIRDQNTFDPSLRMKRLMTLANLFLIHRYKVGWVHYLSPTEDNQRQTQKMKTLGVFSNVNAEAGLIIVAGVNAPRITELLNPDRIALRQLIDRGLG